MLEKIKILTGNWTWNRSDYSSDPILEKLSKALEREIDLRLKDLSRFTDSLPVTEALHLVIGNLTNGKAEIKRVLRSQSPISPNAALMLLDEQIKQTKKILQSEIVAKSTQATEIGSRTLNLLFCARERVKGKFSFVTPANLNEKLNTNGALPSEPKTKLLPDGDITDVQGGSSRLLVSATLLYQIYHSLFPAERMMVAAGKRNERDIAIEAAFDVTGDASAGHVKANANRLGRALISMSETGAHFALWIHSHPGKGREASRPSDIDRNQEIDWLRDYSADLVSAIMVEDGFIRFWGKALEEKRVMVEVAGTGMIRDDENIYRLEY